MNKAEKERLAKVGKKLNVNPLGLQTVSLWSLRFPVVPLQTSLSTLVKVSLLLIEQATPSSQLPPPSFLFSALYALRMG